MNLEWDEAIPMDLHTIWKEFYNDLEEINKLVIPRLVVVDNFKEIELHCFSDASEVAYGANIYLRTKNEERKYTTQLLCSKSRVAPMKATTIPRLELSAALLGTRLAKRIMKAIGNRITKIYYWCDSTIVLSWITEESKHWKTFVANRVAKIQDLTSIQDWRYVNTNENPADILSRGISASSLIGNDMWFHGPLWLRLEEDNWPRKITLPNKEEIPEGRTKIQAFPSTSTPFMLLERFSSLQRLLRVVSYCLRFTWNCMMQGEFRVNGNLTSDELEQVISCVVKLSQKDTFKTEIHDLKNNGFVSQKSKLLQLKPILDEKGIIRVGGRLTKSDLPYEARHPIILDNKCSLTKLIIIAEHERLLHAGPQAVLY